MKLVLVRHGESIWNKENLFTGWTDVDCLKREKKRRQMRDGRCWSRDMISIFVIPLIYKRAIHTLDHILEEMDRCWLPVVKTSEAE